jgi:hypothetical protein
VSAFYDFLKGPFLIGVAWFLWELVAGEVWRGYRQRRSTGWPVAYGLITKASTFRAKFETTLTLEYSYPIAEEPYTVAAEFQKPFDTSEEAQSWARVLSGKNVPVRVNPRNPWKSQLADSDLESIGQSIPVSPQT